MTYFGYIHAEESGFVPVVPNDLFSNNCEREFHICLPNSKAFRKEVTFVVAASEPVTTQKNPVGPLLIDSTPCGVTTCPVRVRAPSVVVPAKAFLRAPDAANENPKKAN